MHQTSQEDEPMTDGEQGNESRTRTANAQLTAGDVNSSRNGEPNREFDAVNLFLFLNIGCISPDLVEQFIIM